MEEISRLSAAFNTFAEASRTLETSYEKLREKIAYLSEELAEKNAQLRNALAVTEETKDYLRGILEGLAEAIVVLDLERNVAMINPAAEELLGLDAAQVTGKPFPRIDLTMDEDGRDTVMSANGKRYNVILSCSEVHDASGRIRGRVLLFQDITRLKELESRNERNHRLIAMGEMAAKIVHEIRSPLCSIELYSGILASELEGAAQADLARGISSGIRSLNSILTNMLYFAKPHRPLQNELSLGEIIEETAGVLAPMLETRHIALEIEKGVPDIVSGDNELIKQVFLNVLLNALQATPEAGKIKVQFRKDREGTTVEVHDEGQGIRPEDSEKIFDPFFTTKERGTGLGLTIVAKIMQAHEGWVKARSGEERGSCFSLFFPEKAGRKPRRVPEGIF